MRNTMLHIMNVFWLGGVPAFVLDFMRAYPQFHHVVAYLMDKTGFGTEDYSMMQEWEYELGCDIGYVDGGKVCPELLDEINPKISIFHCIRGSNVVGAQPYEWLWKWPRIFIHHMATSPIVSAHMHVFVSDFMKRKYEKTLKHLPAWTVCPPTIDTTPYANIPRSPDNKRCVIGKLSSDWQKGKYPAFYLDVVRKITEKYPHVSFEIIGGEKHYGPQKIQRLIMPPARSKPVTEFLSGYDIFCYALEPTQTETWCRAVSEAMAAGLPVIAPPAGAVQEQIIEGKTGHICIEPQQYIEKLSELIEDPVKRYEMGMAGRARACAEFGIPRLHRELDSTIISLLLGRL